MLLSAMHFMNHIAWALLTSAGTNADSPSGFEQQPLKPLGEDNVFGPSFDIFVEDTLRELHVPGLSIAVVDNGKITSKVSPTISHSLTFSACTLVIGLLGCSLNLVGLRIRGPS